MIRRATDTDVDVIVTMALHFQATTSYARHLHATAETLRAITQSLLVSDDAAIWLAEHDGQVYGMLAASLYHQPMSGERIGSELCWWIEPAARGGRVALRLMRTAEAWAKAHGATVFQMMAPAGTTDRLGPFYEALDYVPIETHYQRALA